VNGEPFSHVLRTSGMGLVRTVPSGHAYTLQATAQSFAQALQGCTEWLIGAEWFMRPGRRLVRCMGIVFTGDAGVIVQPHARTMRHSGRGSRGFRA